MEWLIIGSVVPILVQVAIVDLPNFEHLPYFEHHLNKQFFTLQLLNLIHQPKYTFVN